MDRYRRAMGIGNKKVREHHVKKMDELHAKRLREMKPAIDNKPPRQFPARDGKKKFLIEDRYRQIEYDNRLLLERMSEIMRHHTFDGNKGPKREFKSLNKDGRRMELMRITKENQLILKRIQHVKPEYDHVKWEENAKQQLKYKKQICEYPPLELKVPQTAEGNH